MFGNGAKNKDSNKDTQNKDAGKELDSVAEPAEQVNTSLIAEDASTTKAGDASAKAITEVNAEANTPITGHGAFAVSVVPQGVAIYAGFIADGTQELMPLPAIFPNIESALVHLDDLRRLVIMHFGQIAAAEGVQVAELNHDNSSINLRQ